MNFQPLKYIYKSVGNPEASTLLLLHGTGGDENDLIPLATNFGNSFNILSVRGNVSENGMPRFFRRLGMGIFDEEDLNYRTHELVSFLNNVAKKEKFDVSTVVALGYSNGANIAGSVLVMYPNFFAGAILYRPMLPYKLMPEFGNTNNTAIFLSSGKFDPTVNLSDIDTYNGLLKAGGFNVESYVLETGHNLTEEDLRLSAEWVKRTL